MRDLRVGDVLEPTCFEINTWPMKVFSLLMADPNPIHFDPAYVADLGKDARLVNQGTLNLAYPLNALISWLDDPDAATWITSYQCRFKDSLRAGDMVTVSGQVTEEDAESHSVTFSLWVDRQDGRRVLEATAVVTHERGSQLTG